MKKLLKKYLLLLTNSASFALLLSIIFFSYETIENSRETEEVIDNLTSIQESFNPLVDNLKEIEGSLSTRYLGIFPEYIDNINDLFAEAKSGGMHEGDSVIVFEDVLHYGVISDPKGFRLMVRNLLELSQNGGKITIVHYNKDGRMFKQMVTDELVSDRQLPEYRNDVRALFDFRNKRTGRTFNDYAKHVPDILYKYFGKYDFNDIEEQKKVIAILDSAAMREEVMLEHNFRLSMAADKASYERSWEKMNKKIPTNDFQDDELTRRINMLCHDIDSLKMHYMDKPLADVCYMDYLNLYKGMTALISDMFKKSGIEVVPINESIMMCCWMVDIGGLKKAIFAFPSKYSTDEIGFVSKDAAIIKYINTMLRGVKNNLNLE